MNFGDYETPGDWYDAESVMWDILAAGDTQLGSDAYLQDLFDTAMFDPDATQDERNDAYDALVDYMWDEYGLDFEEIFDWEDYREWYDVG